MPRNRVSNNENQVARQVRHARKASLVGANKARPDVRPREAFKDLLNVEHEEAPVRKYQTRLSRSTSNNSCTPINEAHLHPLISETDPYTKAKADSILKYVRSLEENTVIRTEFLMSQKDINDKKRTVLVDWLVHVSLRFAFTQDVLFLSVQILNKYLAKNSVDGERAQLLGATCLLLAAKYEEVMIPELQDFVHIIGSTYNAEDIKQMECQIISAIDGDFSSPTISYFINRFCFDCEVFIRSKYLADYFSELCLLEHTLCRYIPSLIASACILLALGVFNEHRWICRLETVSGYTKRDLVPIMRKIIFIIRKNELKELKNSFQKYSHASYSSVCLYWRLKSSEFLDLKLFSD